MRSAYQTPASTTFIAWQLNSLVTSPDVERETVNGPSIAVPKTATI